MSTSNQLTIDDIKTIHNAIMARDELMNRHDGICHKEDLMIENDSRNAVSIGLPFEVIEAMISVALDYFNSKIKEQEKIIESFGVAVPDDY